MMEGWIKKKRWERGGAETITKTNKPDEEVCEPSTPAVDSLYHNTSRSKYRS